MFSLSSFRPEHRVAYRRAQGAREVAHMLEDSDGPAAGVAAKLLEYHAAGFKATMNETMFGVPPVSQDTVRRECAARRVTMPRHLSDAQEDVYVRNITSALQRERNAVKAYADDAVQRHTGALAHLDAVLQGDRPRIRRAASLHRILEDMQSGRADESEFRFFHDPAASDGANFDRSVIDRGYRILQRHARASHSAASSETTEAASQFPSTISDTESRGFLSASSYEGGDERFELSSRSSDSDIGEAAAHSPPERGIRPIVPRLDLSALQRGSSPRNVPAQTDGRAPLLGYVREHLRSARTGAGAGESYAQVRLDAVLAIRSIRRHANGLVSVRLHDGTFHVLTDSAFVQRFGHRSNTSTQRR